MKKLHVILGSQTRSEIFLRKAKLLISEFKHWLSGRRRTKRAILAVCDLTPNNIQATHELLVMERVVADITRQEAQKVEEVHMFC